MPEYVDFLRISKDEAGTTSTSCTTPAGATSEENLEALKGAEQAGADLVLLTYPPNFYPETEQEVFDYTKAVCDATNLGVILFPMTIWNFSARIHPSDIPTRLVRRLINEVPNVAVIKAEGGYPNIQYAIECHRLFGKEVVISVPIEADLIPLSQVIPIQLSATSDHEYYGPVIPHVMQLLRDGKHDEATEIFWRLHPARKVKAGLFGGLHGGSVLNRQAWKFQGWLQGYNGGPLRMPTMRLQDGQMAALRKGLLDSGFQPSMDPFRDFFVGGTLPNPSGVPNHRRPSPLYGKKRYDTIRFAREEVKTSDEAHRHSRGPSCRGGSVASSSSWVAFRPLRPRRRCAGGELFGDLVFALPDGETGLRVLWAAYEAARLLVPNPGLEVIQDNLRNPPRSVRETAILKVREGVTELRFDSGRGSTTRSSPTGCSGACASRE